VFVASTSNWWASFDFVEFSFFFKSLFSTEYAQCNVCRRVIGLFVQQRVVHSISDIDNLRSDDTSMLYHRSCYKTYTSRRNCGFFKVESAGSDHKPDTSETVIIYQVKGLETCYAIFIEAFHSCFLPSFGSFG
jgi:hypothetical protein